MSNFNKVGTFMKTFGQEVKTKPSFSSDKINKLRIDLIKEELDELQEAMQNNDLLEVADALTDILYVTYGAGHAFGIDLDKCFEEVQNSNMSKLDELQEAMKNNDLLEVADALTDILYVTYGAGHAFGIDLDKCFDEVQNSNMSIRNLKQSVKIAKKLYETEASGNVTLKTVKAIASTGVNRISVGSITNSAAAIDFKLEI